VKGEKPPRKDLVNKYDQREGMRLNSAQRRSGFGWNEKFAEGRKLTDYGNEGYGGKGGIRKLHRYCGADGEDLFDLKNTALGWTNRPCFLSGR